MDFYSTDAAPSEKQAADKEKADDDDGDEPVQSPSRGGRKAKKKDGRGRDPAGGGVREQAALRLSHRMHCCNFVAPKCWFRRLRHDNLAAVLCRGVCAPVSYTHLTLPTTPYV